MIDVMTRRGIRNAATATRRAWKGKNLLCAPEGLVRYNAFKDEKETSCQLGVKSRGIKH